MPGSRPTTPARRGRLANALAHASTIGPYTNQSSHTTSTTGMPRSSTCVRTPIDIAPMFQNDTTSGSSRSRVTSITRRLCRSIRKRPRAPGRTIS